MSDAGLASTKCHQYMQEHKQKTKKLTKEDVILIAIKFALRLHSFYDSPYGIEGNRAVLLYKMSPNNESQILKETLTSLIFSNNSGQFKNTFFVPYHNGVTTFFNLSLTSNGKLEKHIYEQWIHAEVIKLNSTMVQNVHKYEFNSLSNKYFQTGNSLGVIHFIPCYLETMKLLQKLEKQGPQQQNNSVTNCFTNPTQQNTNTNTMWGNESKISAPASTMSPFTIPMNKTSMANNSFQQPNVFQPTSQTTTTSNWMTPSKQFNFGQKTQFSPSFQQQQQPMTTQWNNQQPSKAISWRAPPVATFQTPSPFQNVSNNAPSPSKNQWGMNQNGNNGIFSKSCFPKNNSSFSQQQNNIPNNIIAAPMNAFQSGLFGQPVASSTNVWTSPQNKSTNWNTSTNANTNNTWGLNNNTNNQNGFRSRSGTMEQKSSDHNNNTMPVKKDQLKCRMCNNRAVGRIDCEKWFSKNQRNKARKDNGCIATCINCTNGGNQGQSGGDRSLNQPRPYQNAVKCSQCHRIANGTQQMESYFSKKQRSKSKQGKSCVCIGCTTKNNKQWGH